MKFQNMNNYYISTEKSILNTEKIRSLLTDCFWSKNIPIEYVERFINFSLCFGVYLKHKNTLVGFGRVISDYTTYAYICDVVIDLPHRGKGLCNMLIKKMMSHPDLSGLKTWSLRTTDEAKNIYLKNGFKIATYPETQFEINNLDIYSSPDFYNLYTKKT